MLGVCLNTFSGAVKFQDKVVKTINNGDKYDNNDDIMMTYCTNMARKMDFRCYQNQIFLALFPPLMAQGGCSLSSDGDYSKIKHRNQWKNLENVWVDHNDCKSK